MLPDNETRFDDSKQTWLDELIVRHGGDASGLLQILIEAQERFGHIAEPTASRIALKLFIPLARVQSVASFYSFLHLQPRGEYRVLFSDNITDRMLGSQTLLEKMCQQLWVEPGKMSEDGLVSVGTTSCTGLCDQGPALLVNGRAITRLTHQRVQEIAHLIRNRTPLTDWPADFFRVEDNIRRKGLLLDSKLAPGEVLLAAFSLPVRPEPDGTTSHSTKPASGQVAGFRRLTTNGDWYSHRRGHQAIRPARARGGRISDRPEVGSLPQCARGGACCSVQRRRG
ncbi:MAG: hydrogen dehydrogenase [Gallionellaceae bacterium]|nr:MAG: hydrogen dehydrogenase [Gallionellaceae bacterium]